MRKNGRLVAQCFALGIALGCWSLAAVQADEGQCLDSGCCMYTVNCGSPSANRCCLPKQGEAACNIAECPNYCFEGTSCAPLED